MYILDLNFNQSQIANCRKIQPHQLHRRSPQRTRREHKKEMKSIEEY